MSQPPVTSAQWPVLQLAEFVAVLTGAGDEASALRAAVERAAEAVDAEVGVIFSGEGRTVVATGFGSEVVPVDHLQAVADGTTRTLEVPGVGPCPALAVPLDPDPGGTLVLARSYIRFTGEEQALLRSMGRVLALVVRLLRLYESESSARAETTRLLGDLEERQALLELLLDIQRAIATRTPTDQILDAVVEGGRRLLGHDDAVGIRLLAADAPGTAELVALVGADPSELTARRPVDVGFSGRAITEERLVVSDAYGEHDASDPALTRRGLRAAMAAPVYQDGAVAGAMVVSSSAAGRAYSKHEQDVLLLLAEHVSLALNDASALRAMSDSLDDAVHKATHDELTGLPNRALVLQRLEGALSRAPLQGQPATVFFVDLDRFKMVNDFLGHQNGDRVLMAVAERLRACVRPDDTVGRLAGDEFVVVCEHLAPEEAEAVADRMAGAIAAPLLIDGRDTRITASIGIARGDTGAADQLLGDADVALYRAKEGGRARVEHFDQALRERMQRRLHTEQSLRGALPAGELTLQYQPVVWSPTGEVLALEALLRWQHPERGLVSPDEFVEVAEETGLIVPIGDWVLGQACHDAAVWQSSSAALRGMSLSVNLSARQLNDPDLHRSVRSVLAETGFRADHLWLELTESTLMDDAEATIGTLDALRATGVRFSVDDFGTGYSSLAYLRRFPVDALKIDRSFVAGLGTNPEDEVIVRTVLRMAEELGLIVVAEGVETPTQAHHLAELGCTLSQGWFYGRPMALPDAMRWAAEANREGRSVRS